MLTRPFRVSALLLCSGLALLAASAIAAALHGWAIVSAMGILGLLLATIGVLESGSLSRVQRAFALSPLVPCCIVAALSDTPLWGVVVAPFAYMFSFVLGGPTYLVMRRWGLLHIWQVVGVSALLGAASGAALLAPNAQASDLKVFVGYGAATGLVFWAIALCPWPRSLARRG